MFARIGEDSRHTITRKRDRNFQVFALQLFHDLLTKHADQDMALELGGVSMPRPVSSRAIRHHHFTVQIQ